MLRHATKAPDQKTGWVVRLNNHGLVIKELEAYYVDRELVYVEVVSNRPGSRLTNRIDAVIATTKVPANTDPNIWYFDGETYSQPEEEEDKPTITQYLIAKAEGYDELIWFYFAGGLRYCKKRQHFNNVRRWVDLDLAITFCKQLNQESSGFVVVSTTDYTNLQVEYSENQNNSQTTNTNQMTDFTVRFTSVGGNALEINSQSGGVAMIEEWEKQTRSYFSVEGYNGIQIRGLSEDLTIKVRFQQAQNVPAFKDVATVTVSVTVGALNDYTFPVATSDKLQLMPDKKAIFDAWVSAGSPLLWDGKPGN